MFWLGFAIIAYLTTVLQTTVAPHLSIHTYAPDLLLILTIHYALQAPSNEAPLSGWILGLLADICTLDGTLGPHALAYGVLAAGIVRIRALIFREEPVPQMILALVACCLIQVFAAVVTLIKAGKFETGSLIDAIVTAFFVAVYTACLTPVIHWFLRWGNPLLGIRPARWH